MTITVVAFCGRRRSGKDAAALVLTAGLGFTRLNFADPLKRAVRDLFAMSDDQTDGHLKETPDPRWGGVTPRSVLQFMGTEIMQHEIQRLLPDVGRSFFARRAIMALGDDRPGRSRRIVVTDLRFLHELRALRDRFPHAMVIRVLRPARPHEAAVDDHISETEGDSIPADVVIVNDGSIDSLQAEVMRHVLGLLAQG